MFCLLVIRAALTARSLLGDKKSEEPIYIRNSASQTLVKFAVEFNLTAAAVKTFLEVFSA